MTTTTLSDIFTPPHPPPTFTKCDLGQRCAQGVQRHLPSTGADYGPFVFAGFVLVLIGALCLYLAWERRHDREFDAQMAEKWRTDRPTFQHTISRKEPWPTCETCGAPSLKRDDVHIQIGWCDTVLVEVPSYKCPNGPHEVTK